ncbi:MAG: dienelactone hydrolase family protein [Pirellulales bacterium]
MASTIFAAPPALPFASEPLTWEGDIASKMIDSIDQFLLNQIDHSDTTRSTHWNRDTSSTEAYEKSIDKNRTSLINKLGINHSRATSKQFNIVSAIGQSTAIAQNEYVQVFEVTWPVIDQIKGKGLMLIPKSGKPKASVIVIPDCEQSPEQLLGLTEEGEASPFIFRLVDAGCSVLIPQLIDRKMIEVRRNRNITRRELAHRVSFELGRTLTGYEIQKTQAAIDIFSNQNGNSPIGIFGYGEGGSLALYTAAIDNRVSATVVSGYFNSRKRIWNEPLDRIVFGLLSEFSDADLASMVASRTLIIEAADAPQVTLPSQGGAPAEIRTPKLSVVRAEVDKANQLLGPLAEKHPVQLIEQPKSFGDSTTTSAFASALLVKLSTATTPSKLTSLRSTDPAARVDAMYAEIDRHNQALLVESPYTRSEFMKNLKFDSPEAYQQSSAVYRDHFRTQTIGDFEKPLLPANPRMRLFLESEKWTMYEVVLDVFDEVFAYGLLTIPKDMTPNEKRPVVVCQHGLEGRPQSVIGEEKFSAYKAFAVQLAERGFITFAPQNPYIFTDRFRTLQRKANPLGKTLFSIIVPQHQQITNWLGELPIVDADRIAFYGLSYGGKTAMRVPALVDNYCLSICSADFNDWVWKNASSRSRYSYLFTGEYEIFEWNLGSTFNYSEMAALIAPRPFMVERGHFDGVAPDERVALEYAKVRHIYAAKLGLADKTEIEFFVGPHSINGKKTYDFLHKHLNWPQPETNK